MRGSALGRWFDYAPVVAAACRTLLLKRTRARCPPGRVHQSNAAARTQCGRRVDGARVRSRAPSPVERTVERSPCSTPGTDVPATAATEGTKTSLLLGQKICGALGTTWRGVRRRRRDVVPAARKRRGRTLLCADPYDEAKGAGGDEDENAIPRSARPRNSRRAETQDSPATSLSSESPRAKHSEALFRFRFAAAPSSFRGT